MTGLTKFLRRKPKDEQPHEAAGPRTPVESAAVDISPTDPLIAYFQSTTGAVELDGLELESPAKEAAQASGHEAGRASDQPGRAHRPVEPRPPAQRARLFGRRPQAARQPRRPCRPRRASGSARAPAGGGGAEPGAYRARAAGRAAHPAAVPARRRLPNLPRWQVAPHYRPARTVGGDFYDFIDLPDGHIGIVVGDVTDKGVPAALVMATTHSILRSDAPRLVVPGGGARARANELSVPEIPAEHVRHLSVRGARSRDRAPAFRQRRPQPSLRPHRTAGCSSCGRPECRSGLMPGMDYEEKEAVRRARAEPAAAQRRARRGPRPGSARCSASPGCVASLAGASERQTLIDRLLNELRRVHRIGLGAGGRHHPRDARSLRGRPLDVGASTDSAHTARRVRRWRASRATSAWPMERVAEARERPGLSTAAGSSD